MYVYTAFSVLIYQSVDICVLPSPGNCKGCCNENGNALFDIKLLFSPLLNLFLKFISFFTLVFEYSCLHFYPDISSFV